MGRDQRRLKPLALLLFMLMASLLVACTSASASSWGPAEKDPSLSPAAPGDGSVEPDGAVTVAFPQVDGAGAGGPQLKVARNQTYQWAGIVVIDNVEGRHYVLKRECDVWVLLPQTSEHKAKLEKLLKSKAVIWGRVQDGPSVFMRNAIEVESIFGPGDPMPQTLVAVPEYPCPTRPQPKPMPSPAVMLEKNEVAVRGTLVWENFQPYLQTPSGKIALSLPAMPQLADAPAGAALDAERAAQALMPQLEVGAVGRWSFTDRGLTLAARVVRGWPFRVVVQVACDPAIQAREDRSIALEPGEMAARGQLVREAGRFFLKTDNGQIFLTLPDRAVAEAEEMLRLPEVAVAGKWNAEGRQLSVKVRVIFRTNVPCPQPFQPILPGEIAALGTLVWEYGRAYLDTPSGKIALLIPVTASDAAPQTGVPGGLLSPEALRNTADSAAPSTTAPLRLQIVAVGKWAVQSGQLTITVRYAVPWPSSIPWLDKLPLPRPLAAETASGRLEVAPPIGAIAIGTTTR